MFIHIHISISSQRSEHALCCPFACGLKDADSYWVSSFLHWAELSRIFPWLAIYGDKRSPVLIAGLWELSNVLNDFSDRYPYLHMYAQIACSCRILFSLFLRRSTPVCLDSSTRVELSGLILTVWPQFIWEIFNVLNISSLLVCMEA